MSGKNKTATDQGTKWTLKQHVRSLEENIITISGPALAISGVIAGIDVLTSNIIRTNFPMVGNVLGVVWAFCLMISLDFQVLTLGVKASRLYRDTSKKGWAKFLEVALCVLFACAISYVSVQMGTIFAQSLGMGSTFTIEDAEAHLGINPIWLFYERSALVMLLIFMSGWLRDVEMSPENATQATPAPLQGSQPSELAEVLKQIVEMNAQTLQTVQQMTQQQKPVTIEQATIEQITRVTVAALQQALPEVSVPLQIAAPTAHENATKANVAPFQRDYKPEIELLLLENPVITPDEVVQKINCSLPTAKKWLAKLSENA
jgi:hypothetical protein